MKKLDHLTIKNRQHTSESITDAVRMPVYFLCENIRSLFNVGAVFRTGDALRIAKLYLCGFTGTPPRPEIDKVALGAVESVPWEYVPSTGQAIQILKSQGVKILALEHTDSSIDFQSFSYQFPVGIVFGHEYYGIDEMTLSQCDAAVEIPMYGIKQSLNVATACGVIGYEVLRQLNDQGK